jgi:hypothetical protein
VIPHAAVLRVFALTAMDRVIPNFASLPEALAQAHAVRAGVISARPGGARPAGRVSRRDARAGKRRTRSAVHMSKLCRPTARETRLTGPRSRH